MTQGYQALRERAAWIDLSGRGHFRAAGRDRVRWLHNISSNNIKELTPGNGCYAFFLTAQGRIVADANILCLPDALVLDTEPETREKLLQHVRKYIIADDVKLEDLTEQTAVIGVEGPDALAALALFHKGGIVPSYSWVQYGERILARISATGKPGFRIFAPLGEKDAIVSDLESGGVPMATGEDARAVRLEHAAPRYGDDIYETSLPQETQLMHAISFNKGCYLGQEIVERIRSRGRVNRLLVPVHINSSEPPERGTKVTAGDKEIGEVTSAAFSPALGKVAALAILRAEHISEGAVVKVGEADGTLPALHPSGGA